MRAHVGFCSTLNDVLYHAGGLHMKEGGEGTYKLGSVFAWDPVSETWGEAGLMRVARIGLHAAQVPRAQVINLCVE